MEGSTISVGTSCPVVCEENHEESVDFVTCISAGTFDFASPACTGMILCKNYDYLQFGRLRKNQVSQSLFNIYINLQIYLNL